MIDWLFTNALAALALAAIAGILIWTFRPAPAVRHALWLVVLLKLVSPTGLVVSVPLPVEDPTPAIVETKSDASAPITDEVIEVEVFTVQVTPKPGQSAEDAATEHLRRKTEITVTQSSNVVAETTEKASTELATAASAFQLPAVPFDYRPYVLGLWVAGAVLIGWRQLRETARFARFARRSHPASDSLVAEVAIVANRLGVRVPAVRVMTGLASPVLWCLWRPVLMWPAGLDCRLKGEGRRAVLAHELAHLRRRDHWVRRLEMVAAVLHWWNPLFWLARKKIRADAELACDAWAAGQADRRAYAEALLEVCSFNPRRRPAPAVGVFGEGRRAMQERLTMIMRDRVPCRLAFGAKLVVALMALAAIPAWTLGPGAEPAAAQSSSDAQVQELEAQIKALAAKLEALKAAKSAEAADAQKAKAVEALKRAQETLGEKLKVVQGKVAEVETKEAGQRAKVITAGEGGYKVIGPDGKEVKGAKVIVVDPTSGSTPNVIKVAPPTTVQGTINLPRTAAGKVQYELAAPKTGTTALWTADPANKNVYTFSTTAASGSQAVTLSRATYKLNKDQAAALSTLLGSIKATVMETKVDGESITVTTTPEAQAAIGQIVRLIQGQGGTARYEYRLTPAAPATPATPARPSRPAPPAKPGEPVTVNFEDLKIQLDNLKNLGVELKIDALKEVEKLKELKELKDIRIDVEKMKQFEKLKDLEKLKELENLKDFKDVEKLKEAIKLLSQPDKVKPSREKKPDEPSK